MKSTIESQLKNLFPGRKESVLEIKGTTAHIFFDYLFLDTVFRQAKVMANFLTGNDRFADVESDSRLVAPFPVAKHYVSRARLSPPIEEIKNIAVHTLKDSR
ncbi:MAG: hypothetical protein WC880_03270 [Candidatus Paceibacterota bacterium]